MANTYLTKTFVSGGSTTKWTYSVWLKRSKLSYDTANIFGRYQSSDYFTGLYFTSADGIQFLQKHGGSNAGRLMTNDLYRDISGWYHIVAVWDSSNSTADDRMKLYVNGVSPSITNRINPSSGQGSTWNTANPNNDIGRANGMDGNTNYFDGLMSHIHFCDGYAYSASDFGSTDATTGEWKINTSPSVSYGTTGFSILKDGITITDQSANSNNWTLGGGTLTKTEDCPSSVFATQNKLDALFPTTSVDWAFSNGNNQVVSGKGANSSTGYSYNNATIAVSKGKFYWEVKPTNVDGSSFIGIISEGQLYNQNLNEITNSNAYAWTIRNSNGNVRNNNSNITYAASYTTNDIISVALDLDNNKIYWAKNGVWGNGSGAWGSSTFDAAVGAVTITAPASTKNGHYFPTLGASDYSESSTFQTNFGNGYFGTTAVSSAGTNASGNGIFEYNVPTGFTALSTKGLNS